MLSHIPSSEEVCNDGFAREFMGPHNVLFRTLIMGDQVKQVGWTASDAYIDLPSTPGLMTNKPWNHDEKELRPTPSPEAGAMKIGLEAATVMRQNAEGLSPLPRPYYVDEGRFYIDQAFLKWIREYIESHQAVAVTRTK